MQILVLSNYIKILIVVALAFLLIVYTISIISKTRKRSSEEQEEHIRLLEEEIKLKTAELIELNNEVYNKTINRIESLTNVEISVLDIYEKSNIKIPIDIIEELSRMKLSSRKEIFDYIENQRYLWKLENTKKPYKGAK